MANPMHQRRKGTSSFTQNHHGVDLEGGMSSTMQRGPRNSTYNHSYNKNSNSANADILEQQNNERLDDLADHVARLKGLTLDIGQEVREQNSLLEQMDGSFGNTRDLLQHSLRRIGTLLERGGGKHMLYMVLFCVLVLSFLYWLMTYKGTSGA